MIAAPLALPPASRTIGQDGTTPVLFRATGPRAVPDVCAVFPTVAADSAGGLMMCVRAALQVASASSQWLARTRPARPEEFAALRAQLEAPPNGYRLRVVQRIGVEMPAVRRARALRGEVV